MSDLKFSVAISVYKSDNAEHFDRALSSITVKQTVKPNEIVLVVDGPVGEGINTVIEKYSSIHKDFKVIRLEKNGGLGNALRIAVDNCSHNLVARMDSDDVSVPTRFAEQIECFANDKSLDIVGGDISEFIGKEDNIVAYRKVPVSNDDIYEYMKKRCPLNHVSVMFKKASVLAAGGYLDLFWNEDYYLWIRMAQNKARMINTGTVLVNVRTGEDMYGRRGGKEYFRSEKFLQKYMLDNGMISYGIYCSNVIKRWIVQRLLSTSMRGFVYRTFARR